jgi:hypothetical protein
LRQPFDGKRRALQGECGGHCLEANRIKLWVEQWWDPQQRGLLDAVGQVFGEHRASIREALQSPVLPFLGG